MLSHATEQLLHLLLSTSVDLVAYHRDERPIPDAIGGPNRKYARLQLWFAEDLDLAIASSTIQSHVKNSDAAKLVVRQGPIYTSCKWI